jgi:hypothetical protein
MHVDELREQEFDAVVLHDPPDIVGVLGLRSHAVEVYPRAQVADNGSKHP